MIAKKNTHRRPSRQTQSTGLEGRRILCGRYADCLGSAMRPLAEYEKCLALVSGSGPMGMKKPTSGWKWALREAVIQLSR